MVVVVTSKRTGPLTYFVELSLLALAVLSFLFLCNFEEYLICKKVRCIYMAGGWGTVVEHLLIFIRSRV